MKAATMTPSTIPAITPPVGPFESGGVGGVGLGSEDGFGEAAHDTHS